MSRERRPDEYDRHAKAEIERFTSREPRMLARVGRTVTWPLSKATEIVVENTPLGAAVKGVMSVIKVASQAPGKLVRM